MRSTLLPLWNWASQLSQPPGIPPLGGTQSLRLVGWLIAARYWAVVLPSWVQTHPQPREQSGLMAGKAYLPLLVAFCFLLGSPMVLGG